MREEKKEVIYVLNYREKGEKKQIEFLIDFVSLDVILSTEKLIEAGGNVSRAWKSSQEKTSKMLQLSTEKPEGYKQEIEKLKDEIRLEIQEIEKNNKSGNDLVGEQIRVVTQLLVDNGVKDEKFLSRTFWEKNVDGAEPIKLLISVVRKDLDTGKKKIIQ
jgi:hypothetical protein